MKSTDAKQAQGMSTFFKFTIPVVTGRGLNDRKNRWVKAERNTVERDATLVCFPRLAKNQVPALVKLVRCAPPDVTGRFGLDDDNLAGALKQVRDAVAKQLGVDDRDPRVDFMYGQKPAPRHAVEVIIEAGPDVHVRANCDDPTCRAHWKAA